MVAVALVLGAAAQGLVGLGLGLVAAPVTMLVEPGLMPDLLLWLAMLYPVATLVREHDEIDWRALRWALAARVPGTVVGVLLVAAFSDRLLGIAVAVMVLLSVALTATTIVVPVGRSTLVGAGFASGITGTATSIGGPPLALLLQHRDPLQLRTTLAVYFLVGAAISLLGLSVGGDLEPPVALIALALTPALLVGLLLARVLHPRLRRGGVRWGVLALCAASALVLLVRSLVA
ncbi:sulfite exporter TauE/SafE family protein [Nocardioides bigeumensis]|uniref:Probable membrane transporter protein n=1 Tax=Nocardioides bigeumensis TaxID=433657 RepID=A0ABN2XX74_9ACTN